ncbi:MAG: PAS domain-containing protein [Nitrospirae bacterium]|nr:MAG: PAS domain-containing protein [Nitrospirota bacterium]
MGRSPEEIIGKKCYEVFHKKSAPWSKCPHHKTLSTGKPCVKEIEDPAMGGTFLISNSPIYDSNGELIGTVHISRDVTEIYKMRKQLAVTERKAALGEMAAQVAHEIRNPLIPIGGFARYLENHLKGELKNYANIITEEVNRLESILADILSFVKESRIEKSPANINTLLEDTIRLVKNVTSKKGNRIIKNFYPGSIIVNIDFNRMKEAILNILINANEATEKGTITVSSALVDESTVCITIEDTGRGIKEEDLKKIFDPFFTTNVRGTGLGLTIANKIIEEHGGSIEVKSQIGRGTKFNILLPIKDEEV